MSKQFVPLRTDGNLGADIERYLAAPWQPAATRMFTEWRDTKSPNVCTLCWLRFMEECERALAAFADGKTSFMLKLPYLSNGLPPHHYQRRIRPEDLR